MLEAVYNTPGIMVCDTETDGLYPYSGNRICGVGILAPKKHDKDEYESFYLPFRHKEGENLPIECMYYLNPILAEPDRYLVNHNIKFDVHCFEVEGIRIRNRLIDTMLGAHLANENEMSFKLESLAKKYIRREAGSEEKELIDKIIAKVGKVKKSIVKSKMHLLPPEDVAPYALADVQDTWELAKFYSYALKKQGLEWLWEEVNDYSRVVQNMERRGVLIDPIACKSYAEYASEKRNELYYLMVKYVGHEFNPNSVPQLRKILNQKDTNKDALAVCNNPIAPYILQYRAWEKAINTYYSRFLELVDETSRIHPSLNLHGTISGRLSCRDPNLQALPKKKDQYRVRDLVTAPLGFVLMAWDYSQIEARILAHYTKSPFLIDIFENDKDIHDETAKIIQKDREKAKRTNYGIIYGIGVDGLSNDLKITKKEASQILNRYHKQIPEIKQLYYASERIAKQKKYIPMWTGRRRHYRPEDATHKAMSNLIQGAVAEIMRETITKLDKELSGNRIYMNLQVHDEILFEVPKDDVGKWSPIIKEIMEDFNFRVPIVAEGKVGKSWGDRNMVSIEEYLQIEEEE